MGFLKNIAGKASKWAYNDAKKTYENGKKFYSFKMDQADRAKAERKQAETARVKTANVNGITNYAVYTRNPSRR